MAKNALSQKKRVTHIKSVLDNQYNEGEMQSESFDYVYNIMRDMDSMKSADNSLADDLLKVELLSLTNDEHAQVQNPPISSSNDCTQAVKTCSQTVKTDVTKFKKFSIVRKFPLMEKSQKILKQLKHNRSIPKPRAHLASIDIFPGQELSNDSIPSKSSKNELEQKRFVTKKQKKTVKTKILTQIKKNTLANKSEPVLTASNISHKSKELCIIKNKTKDLTQVNTKVTTKTSAKISESVLVMPNVNHKNKELFTVKNQVYDQSLKKMRNRYESSNKHMDARQSIKTDCNINDTFSSKNILSDELSDGNTTDSEYERFIKSNKVEFEDKICKKTKKKHSKKKKVSRKKISHYVKNLQKSFPLESPHEQESNCLDDLSYHDSSDEGGKFEEEIPQKSKKKHSKKKVIQKKKLQLKKKSQKSFPLECPTDLSDDGDNKEPERIERSISMESVVDYFDSNCYNDSSSDEGGETDKKIESTVLKSNVSLNDKHKNILLKKFETVDDNIGSNEYSVNKDENKSNYYPITDFSSINLGDSSEQSNLGSNLNSTIRFEDNICIAPLKSGTMISETSMNCTKNTDSKLHNSSASKCVSIYSNLYKSDKCPVESGVIDLSISDSEPENTESPQLTVQKENFEEFKEAQNSASTNADSEESDIEVIEVVPASNGNKLETTCNVPATCLEDLNRMTGVNSTNYKEYENEIKFSQTGKFENTAQKITEPMVLDSNVNKTVYSSSEAHLIEKLVKREPLIIESNNPVYMTGMCKEYNENEIISKINYEPLGSSTAILNECKQEKCEVMQCDKNPFVDEDDDIMIIEPPINHEVKQEILDDDVIIDYVSVKKEQNPESNVTHCVSSKRKNEICTGELESNIKSECSNSCKVPKFSNIVDNTSIVKELPIMNCPFTKSVFEQSVSSDALTNSKVQPLLELYKKEFSMYQEILRTEENVEAGLKMVEAHQAEKLKCIRALIQNLVKNYSCCDETHNDPVKIKEQDSLQGSVQLKVFQNSPVDKIQSSSSKNSSEVCCRNIQDSSDSSSKFTPSFPSVSIKTEKEEKPDSCVGPMSVNISHSVARIKTEPGTSGISEVFLLSCDVPEDKQALKLLGKKCDVCGKDAVAACQRCAKAFFCSNQCGKKFWNDGHERICDQYV